MLWTLLLPQDDLLHIEFNTLKIKWYSVFEITSLSICDPSALANSPTNHFSGRQRYHQCPDWDQTFSKGSFTSLLKLSMKSTFGAPVKDKTKISMYDNYKSHIIFLNNYFSKFSTRRTPNSPFQLLNLKQIQIRQFVIFSEFLELQN